MTDTVNRLLVLDDETTWPPELCDVLVKSEPVLRGFALEEIRILNDDTRDGRYLPWALRDPNAFWQQHEDLLTAVEDSLKTEWLRGYHCTKLTASEAAKIESKGMTPPTQFMLNARVDQLCQRGTIKKSIAGRLLSKNQAHENSRSGKIWFIFTSALLREESGVGDFFRYWGGEALYNSHDNDPVTSPILQSIGEAYIAVAAVPVSGLNKRHALSEVVTRRFLAARGADLTNGLDYDSWIEQAVPEGQIQRIIGQREDAFEVLTGCREWRHSLLVIKGVRPIPHRHVTTPN